ncbi:hypothetical protein BKA63DRAFT_497397 [Paraphoma chrysanthemicola]|nr:hypothetical protein BKA63DRAFT_497397 [Paraphoma chrysanthemicola]
MVVARHNYACGCRHPVCSLSASYRHEPSTTRTDWPASKSSAAHLQARGYVRGVGRECAQGREARVVQDQPSGLNRPSSHERDLRQVEGVRKAREQKVQGTLGQKHAFVMGDEPRQSGASITNMMVAETRKDANNMMTVCYDRISVPPLVLRKDFSKHVWADGRCSTKKLKEGDKVVTGRCPLQGEESPSPVLVVAGPLDQTSIRVPLEISARNNVDFDSDAIQSRGRSCARRALGYWKTWVERSEKGMVNTTLGKLGIMLGTCVTVRHGLIAIDSEYMPVLPRMGTMVKATEQCYMIANTSMGVTTAMTTYKTPTPTRPCTRRCSRSRTRPVAGHDSYRDHDREHNRGDGQRHVDGPGEDRGGIPVLVRSMNINAFVDVDMVEVIHSHRLD